MFSGSDWHAERRMITIAMVVFQFLRRFFTSSIRSVVLLLEVQRGLGNAEARFQKRPSAIFQVLAHFLFSCSTIPFPSPSSPFPESLNNFIEQHNPSPLSHSPLVLNCRCSHLHITMSPPTSRQRASDEETPLLGRASGAKKPSAINKHLSADVSKKWADLVLLYCYIITGLLDSSAVFIWGSFVSMQTGSCHVRHSFTQPFLTHSQETPFILVLDWSRPRKESAGSRLARPLPFSALAPLCLHDSTATSRLGSAGSLSRLTRSSWPLSSLLLRSSRSKPRSRKDSGGRSLCLSLSLHSSPVARPSRREHYSTLD